MRLRSRFTSGWLALGLTIGLVGVAAPATAAAIYPMIFPVVGDVSFTDTFGAPRSGGRTHEGTDIMGAKMLPVVAVADGTVGWIGSTCCYFELEHDDGYSSWYIHLNNDTPGTDDGLAWGIAPGITTGVRVTAGQLIGWVGDSGNAEWTGSHLHFELRDPDGTAINAYESLLAAPRLSAPGVLPEPVCPEGEVCDSVALQSSGGRFTLWEGIPPEATNSFYYGNPGDVAFSGDWDCDGVDTLGLYRRSDGYVYLRNSNTQGVADISFFFGNPGDYPVGGDFDGDGCDTVSIYRPSQGRFYIIDTLGSNDGGLGSAEYDFGFGNVGDKPFVGDFDGDGIDTIGLHRESSGYVYFRNSLTSGVAEFEFYFGDPGDVLLAGDWDGDGDDTVGVYRPSKGSLYLKFENSAGVADATVVSAGFVGAVTMSG
jgi:Peptidase family M23